MPSRRLESQEGRLLYVLGNGEEKVKIEEEAIREILVGNTDFESGAEVSDFNDFEEEEQLKQQASAKVLPQAATSG